MRALLQRVSHASVTVDGAVIGQTGPGLLILICAMQGDTEAQADHLAAKIAKLRIFKDDAGKMNKSVRDIGGSALVVSQFTLAADTKRGNRPGFSTAAPPAEGERLYDYFANRLAQEGVPVETGLPGLLAVRATQASGGSETKAPPKSISSGCGKVTSTAWHGCISPPAASSARRGAGASSGTACGAGVATTTVSNPGNIAPSSAINIQRAADPSMRAIRRPHSTVRSFARSRASALIPGTPT